MHPSWCGEAVDHGRKMLLGVGIWSRPTLREEGLCVWGGGGGGGGTMFSAIITWGSLDCASLLGNVLPSP